MPLHPDDTICFCFHVPLRKIEAFCKIEKPLHPSQISDCLSAGTGCGWCVPILKKIHLRICGQPRPWWRTPPTAPGSPEETPPSPDNASNASTTPAPAPADRDAPLDAAAYKAARKTYLAQNQITPPKGAEL